MRHLNVLLAAGAFGKTAGQQFSAAASRTREARLLVSAAPFCRSPSVALHGWAGERASFGPESSSAGVVKTPVFSGPPDARSLPQSLVLDLYYSFAFFSFRFIFLSAQAGLELAAVILPQSPRCWDYWCAPPRLSLKIFCRILSCKHFFNAFKPRQLCGRGMTVVTSVTTCAQ